MQLITNIIKERENGRMKTGIQMIQNWKRARNIKGLEEFKTLMVCPDLKMEPRIPVRSNLDSKHAMVSYAKSLLKALKHRAHVPNP